MVTVKSNVLSGLASVIQLGLSQDAIVITEQFQQDDIGVDAYGNTPSPNPPDLQVFGAQAMIDMDLVHYDVGVLQECIRLSMGNGIQGSEGLQGRAGTLMGGNQALYGPQNFYISVGISSPAPQSPIGGVPWFFPTAYLWNQPVVYPLGTKRSVVRLRWRAIAYSIDPWNGGTGSLGVPIYTHAAFPAAM